MKWRADCAKLLFMFRANCSGREVSCANHLEPFALYECTVTQGQYTMYPQVPLGTCTGEAPRGSKLHAGQPRTQVPKTLQDALSLAVHHHGQMPGGVLCTVEVRMDWVSIDDHGSGNISVGIARLWQRYPNVRARMVWAFMH